MLFNMEIMMSFSDDIIGAVNTTSRNVDDILNINNVYVDNMVKSSIPFRASS